MNIPSATYRLQFSPEFTFASAEEIVPYLEKLGISHIYASPVFKARSGSTHGYDIVDPRSINPELGGKEGLDSLLQKCSSVNIGWIQDIVPNHMALSSENPFLFDVWENGPLSQYYSFFDIEWDHPYEALRGKLLVPVLGNNFGKCLEAGELDLKFDRSGLHVTYYNHRFPLRMESYATVFGMCVPSLRDELGDRNSDLLKFLGLLYTVKNLPAGDIAERYEQIGFVKTLLWEMFAGNETIQRHCLQVIDEYNGENRNADRWSLLESVLAEQYFRLTFWKTATQELNYRRFFTINDLIAIRVEDEAVMAVTHSFLYEYAASGKFHGIRVDHIDGLYNPAQYCERLRRSAPGAYIVVEKILAHDEDLRSSWPIQGTTGYDFLNIVNRLFCSSDGRRAIDRTYATIAQDDRSYNELATDKKRLIIGRHMAGDIDNLALRLKKLAGHDRRGIDITMYGLRRALVEILTSFPIYRTYLTETEQNATDRMILKKAISIARRAQDEFATEFDYIESLLDLDNADMPDESVVERRRFVMRLQQFTGPLLAKGIEDTALYSYNRLISLNEVGGDPGLFGIGINDFHEFCIRRAEQWPNSMNATATHDTKRGEDARARINVLSELGSDWSRKIHQWHTLNKNLRIPDADGDEMPVMNDEYLFYQTLIGSFPFEGYDPAAYCSRVGEYMIKAVREAKVHSSWIRPNESYEKALLGFVGRTLSGDPGNSFLREFVPFQKTVAWYGMINSISQTTLKITAPGMPDFYQGTELWDFSMVDPDNRRAVDFEVRKRFIDELLAREHDSGYLEEIVSHPYDGRIKLFLIRQLLLLRRRLAGLFAQGRYIPLTVTGRLNSSIIAFMRSSKEGNIVVVAPRMPTRVVKEGQMPFGRGIWGDTMVLIPESAGGSWTNCLTGEITPTSDKRLPAGDVMSRFPVAVLYREAAVLLDDPLHQ